MNPPSINRPVKNGVLIKADCYEEFVIWSALPADEKRNIGIETFQAFADANNITPQTISRWRKRPDFEKKRREAILSWAKDKTPSVIKGIYASAVRGNPGSQAIWLGWVEDYNQKEGGKVVQNTFEIRENDIRALINQLPQDLQIKHYANLQQLLDDAQHLRFSGQLQDGVIRSEGGEGDVQDETDQPTHIVPNRRGNEVPASNPYCLCKNMEWKVSTYYHQSASRWWEE